MIYTNAYWCARNGLQVGRKYQIKQTFNKLEKEAGLLWLHSCLRRNPELAVRKAGIDCLEWSERLSIHFFNKPVAIYKIDDTELQLNVKRGMVIGEKGSKSVSVAIPQERGETTTVIMCCNAEGTFLLPECICQRTNRKAEFLDDMPPKTQLT